MKAPLIFCSTSHSINVQKIFKVGIAGREQAYGPLAADAPLPPQIILSKAFDLKCTIPEIKDVGEPLLIYVSAASATLSAATLKVLSRWTCSLSLQRSAPDTWLLHALGEQPAGPAVDSRPLFVRPSP